MLMALLVDEMTWNFLNTYSMKNVQINTDSNTEGLYVTCPNAEESDFRLVYLLP
jgi:hypothetical protein